MCALCLVRAYNRAPRGEREATLWTGTAGLALAELPDGAPRLLAVQPGPLANQSPPAFGLLAIKINA